MLWLNHNLNKSSLTALLTGFRAVRSVLNPDDEELFGVIELTPEYVSHKNGAAVFTAALHLNGSSLNRDLSDPKDEADFFNRLCQTLPSGSSAQFLLRRRQGELGSHYASQQDLVAKRLDAEAAGCFVEDYLDSVVYKVEDSGLSEIWYGLLVSAASQAALADSLALLVANLPCEATPCNANQLSQLLLDSYAPNLLDKNNNESELYAEWLAQSRLHLGQDAFCNHEFNIAYWTLSASPSRLQTSWTQALFKSEKLRDFEFDISVSLLPAQQDTVLKNVLERRFYSIAAQLEAADSAEKYRLARDLREEAAEVERKLATFTNAGTRFFELGITLALRSEAENFLEDCTTFEQELQQLGLAVKRVEGSGNVLEAVQSCAPLNLPRTPRPFVLPAVEAGRLAHLLNDSTNLSSSDLPLVGMSEGQQAVYFDPTPTFGDAASFWLGDSTAKSTSEAVCLVRYLLAMRFLQGQNFLGFDRRGDWQGLVADLGGRYVLIGSQYHLNPLEVSQNYLEDSNNVEVWVDETSQFLAELLQLGLAQIQQLQTLLTNSATAFREFDVELSAGNLWLCADSNGYLELAQSLRHLCLGGKFGKLFSTPSCLPNLNGNLVFVGLSPEIRQTWSERAQTYYFTKVATAICESFASNQNRTLLIDNAHEWLNSLTTLTHLVANSKRLGLKVWLVSPTANNWMSSYHARTFIRKVQTHVCFQQSNIGLTGLALQLGLSQRFLQKVYRLSAGAAVVRQANNLFAFEPLPTSYISRTANLARRLGTSVVASVAVPASLQQEPLFANWEIWNSADLQDLAELNTEPLLAYA